LIKELDFIDKSHRLIETKAKLETLSYVGRGRISQIKHRYVSLQYPFVCSDNFNIMSIICCLQLFTKALWFWQRIKHTMEPVDDKVREIANTVAEWKSEVE
jgi:hypothetical protein